MSPKTVFPFVTAICFTLYLSAGTLPWRLFENHTDGYNMYRIPAVVKAKSGKLLAFCEGRQSIADHGNVDLVLKISTDDGKTWNGLKVIWNDGDNTCGNPSPVVDMVTGEVIVLATLNNDRVFVLRSKNEGENWETPEDITTAIKPVDWKWYATGPVHAIQMQNAGNKGRLIVPCNHTVGSDSKHISHVIYSDDHGKTWNTGGSVPTAKTDECTVAELSGGDMLLNMRNNDRTLPNRKTSLSHDGGITWLPAEYDSTLIEPVCQGALLRYSFNPDVLLFSNPSHTSQRKNLVLSVSYNGGKTWAKKISIYTAKAAYNDMVALANGDVLCLFETGRVLPYSGIAVKVISATSFGGVIH